MKWILSLLASVFALLAIASHAVVGGQSQTPRPLDAMLKDAQQLALRIDGLQRNLTPARADYMVVYVKLDAAQPITLTRVSLQLDYSPVRHHEFSPRQLRLLAAGGVVRVWDTPVEPGSHVLRVKMKGADAHGNAVEYELMRAFRKTDAEAHLTMISASQLASTD